MPCSGMMLDQTLFKAAARWICKASVDDDQTLPNNRCVRTRSLEPLSPAWLPRPQLWFPLPESLLPGGGRGTKRPTPPQHRLLIPSLKRSVLSLQPAGICSPQWSVPSVNWTTCPKIVRSSPSSHFFCIQDVTKQSPGWALGGTASVADDVKRPLTMHGI